MKKLQVNEVIERLRSEITVRMTQEFQANAAQQRQVPSRNSYFLELEDLEEKLKYLRSDLEELYTYLSRCAREEEDYSTDFSDDGGFSTSPQPVYGEDFADDDNGSLLKSDYAFDHDDSETYESDTFDIDVDDVQMPDEDLDAPDPESEDDDKAGDADIKIVKEGE